MIVGLDVGSSSVKAVAVDEEGVPLHATRVRSRPRSHRRGDGPEAMWRDVVDVLGRLCSEAGRPDAVSLSTSMHSLVITSSGGRVETWSTWLDRRADGVTGPDEGRRLYEATGCPPWGVYLPAALAGGPVDLSIPRLMVRTLKEWLLGRLTGEEPMDLLTASTTGLLSLEHDDWSDPALDVAGVDHRLLPELVPPTEVVPLSPWAAEASGLSPGTPVVTGGPDGILSHLAVGQDRLGTVSLSVGTTAAVRVRTSSPWLHPEMRTWCYRSHPTGRLVGIALNNAGLLLDWARRLLFPDHVPGDGFADLFQAAGEVPVGADGVRLDPRLVAERDERLGGPGASLAGLRAHHDRRHVARAMVDAVVTTLAATARALDGVRPQEEWLDVVGLPVRYPIFAQALSDGLGRPLRLLSVSDASALGAALLGHEALTGDRPVPRFETSEVFPREDQTSAYAGMSGTLGVDLAAR